MRTRSAAKKSNKVLPQENEGMMEFDEFENNLKKRTKAKVQSSAAGYNKEKVNLGLLKDYSDFDYSPYNSEDSHESDDSNEEEIKVKIKEEIKDENKLTLEEIKKLISESEYKGKLELNTEPYSFNKLLRKTTLTFDSAIIGEHVKICTGMNILFKSNIVGRLREIRSIELQIINKKLSKVIIQTEIFVTPEDIKGECTEDWLNSLKEIVDKKDMESNEVIKIIGGNISTTTVLLDIILKNLSEIKNVQLCNSEDEVSMKHKLNTNAMAFLCNKEFHINSKKLMPLTESIEIKEENESFDASVEKIEPAKRISYGKKDAMLNLYDTCCRKLELNALPDYLPCREKERAEIHDFIKLGIETKGSATSLYISGMPGTGKTATVLEVIKRLKEDSYKGLIPTFEFININGMAIGNIYMVYSIIHKSIKGTHATSSQAILFLDKYFKRKKVEAKGVNNPEMVRVILIDELDGLFNKKQDLLYNLFDWPSYAQARLVVIGIANTMNLPEEFQGKIASRIGCKRLIYEPYNKDQIQVILNTRISSMDLFEGDAVRHVSSKVAALSGDMRRCLQIAKRSIELARKAYLESESDDPMKVHIDHLVSASNELFNSKVTALIKCLTEYEILVLGALTLEKTHARIDVIEKQKLYPRVEQVINKVGKKFLRTSEIDYIVIKLNEFGLISLDDRSKKQVKETITVHVFNDEFITAVSGNETYKGIIELIDAAE